LRTDPDADGVDDDTAIRFRIRIRSPALLLIVEVSLAVLLAIVFEMLLEVKDGLVALLSDSWDIVNCDNELFCNGIVIDNPFIDALAAFELTLVALLALALALAPALVPVALLALLSIDLPRT
jgi:hypothetical protein